MREGARFSLPRLGLLSVEHRERPATRGAERESTPAAELELGHAAALPLNHGRLSLNEALWNAGG
jgi:hypothetical protein